MSKYTGLDKISRINHILIETYNGCRILECISHDDPQVNAGILVMHRGWLVDEQLGTVENARRVADQFMMEDQ